MTAPPPPAHQRPTPRAELDVRIDDAWHRAKFATEPAIAVRYWLEHNALVAQRARQRVGVP